MVAVQCLLTPTAEHDPTELLSAAVTGRKTCIDLRYTCNVSRGSDLFEGWNCAEERQSYPSDVSLQTLIPGLAPSSLIRTDWRLAMSYRKRCVFVRQVWAACFMPPSSIAATLDSCWEQVLPENRAAPIRRLPPEDLPERLRRLSGGYMARSTPTHPGICTHIFYRKPHKVMASVIWSRLVLEHCALHVPAGLRNPTFFSPFEVTSSIPGLHQDFWVAIRHA